MKSIIPSLVFATAMGGISYQLFNGAAVSHSIVRQLNEKLQSSGIGRDSSLHWPPELGELYPDLELFDQMGNRVRLSQFKGKLILVEPIGMSCPACQAFCGGHERGGFAGIQPQPDLPSLAEAARAFGNFDLADPEIVKIHLLLYAMDMQAPSHRDAAAWSAHFDLDREKNEIVLVGTTAMRQDSYRLIPGLQVIDRDFRLRFDSTGHKPRHDLYRVVLPELGNLVSSDGIEKTAANATIDNPFHDG